MEREFIAVCFALAEEAGPFRKVAGDSVPVFITGIGRLNAEKAAREYFKDHSPGLLLTCGFAGGLSPVLAIGDVIFEVSSSAGKGMELEAKLISAGAKKAKIHCADRIAARAVEKRKLHDETGADAAEMESGAIQSVCRERGILCATVRVISDTANEDLPVDFNDFLKPDKSVDMGKLFLTAAMSPKKMAGLMELQKKTKLAAQRLAEVLVKII